MITASSGTIDFDDENLTTDGRVGIGAQDASSALRVHTSTHNQGVEITSDRSITGFPIDVLRAHYTGADTTEPITAETTGTKLRRCDVTSAPDPVGT